MHLHYMKQHDIIIYKLRKWLMCYPNYASPRVVEEHKKYVGAIYIKLTHFFHLVFLRRQYIQIHACVQCKVFIRFMLPQM